MYSATIEMAFLKQTLSFLNITICQHVFIAPASLPHLLQQHTPYTLKLPSPCDTASPSAASAIVSTDYSSLPAVASGDTFRWSQQPLPQSLKVLSNSLKDCQDYAIAHHYCGYEYSQQSSTCTLVPGSGCYMVQKAKVQTAKSAAAANATVLGYVHFDYSSVYSPPALVNVSHTTVRSNSAFTGFAAIDSPVYTMLLLSADECARRAAAQQVCGWLFVPSYVGKATGSCTSTASCCILNPYRGCAAAPAPPATNTLGIFASPPTPPTPSPPTPPPTPPTPAPTPRPANCSTTYTNLTNTGGVATLPTATGLLKAVSGVTYDGCVKYCCSFVGCVAWDWYSTTDEGFLCQIFKADYKTGPQPWPSGHVLFAQGGVLHATQ
jgi:hypothetical protein